MKRSWLKISLIFILPNIDNQIFNLRQSQEPMVLKQSAVRGVFIEKVLPCGNASQSNGHSCKKSA
jgi:hypothetical protein